MITHSRLSRLGLFDTRVPRYTSYPTAPHFSAATGAAQHVDWIARIPPGSEISLYVHIPFCRRLCWFCACRTQGTQRIGPVATYLEALKDELRLLAEHLPHGIRLSRLHWGGGTPTLLEPGMIADLAGAIFDVAPMAANGEFSVEIDPNEIDAPRLDALAEAGLNRASIGIQDFNPEIQQVIGRAQSFEITRDVVEMIRARHVRSLNADILFGLPHQSPARLTESVEKLLALNPDRVALYGYAHVPWMARRQSMIPSDALPTPQERLSLFESARRLFRWDGFDEIGIDHFATPSDDLSRAMKAGRLRRNFQGYTDDASPVLIGLGASSISRFPQGYTQNASSTSSYHGHIRTAAFATARGHVFRGEDNLRARLIEALMCDFRIDTAQVLREFSVTPQRLRELCETANRTFDMSLQADETGLEIPHDLRPLTRLIARSFDAYEADQKGHSSAI